MSKIPCTIVTGFLGAGKTTLVRHVLSQAGGRRIAVVVNEFGALGIDGEVLKSCGIPGCDDVVELANGCLCCTVADEFLPAMEALLDRPAPPEHIVIETSGLALPQPLLKAFGWPSIRNRVMVDGVVTVVDGPAVADGRFADDPAAVAAQRAADESLDHDNPLSEVYLDQIQCADLVVLNKSDLIGAADLTKLRIEIAAALPRPAALVAAVEGRVDLSVLLGLDARAEDDLASRPSCHDAEDGEHEHDDFDSFVVPLTPLASPEALLDRLRDIAAAHDVLRMKGFAAVADKPMRLAIQGVGTRLRHHFDRAWQIGEKREGHLVVIGQKGIDRAAIEAAIAV